MKSLEGELRELDSKRQDAKIYYLGLFHDMGTPFYGDTENLKFHLTYIDTKYNELRKDIIEKYEKIK